MSSLMINGARFAVATQLAAAIAITAVSNASPAEASAVTLPNPGDLVLVTSNWPDLNGNAFRVGVAAAGEFELLGADSTDEDFYPIGEGVGTYQVASDFVTLNKVRDVSMAGGEPNFYNYQYVEDRSGRQQQAPTFKSAMTLTLQVDYDPSLAQYDAMIEQDRKKTVTVIRETLVNGDVIVYTGYLTFNKVPSKVLNEFMANTLTLSLTGDPVRYAAA